MNWNLIALFCVGSILGAVVNLGIYRLAYFRRRISPWSRTRGLIPPRTWLDHIPIVGWWSLRREAKFHSRGFWIRPMLLELSCGLGLAWFYWWKMNHQPLIALPFCTPLTLDQTIHQVRGQFVVQVALIFLMLIATFIDIDEQTVPDAITIPGTVIALICAAMCFHSMLPGWADQLPQPTRVFPKPPEFRFLPLGFDFPVLDEAEQLGVTSLLAGLAIYLGWCFALLPRRWRPGVGFSKAWRVMWRRIAARPEWKWVLPLAVIGCTGIVAVWFRGGAPWRGLLTALVGLAVGGGMIWIIRLIGSFTLGREAMGFGDVTLMAMIGAFLGWQPVLIAFFIAPLVGAVVGLLLWIVIRDNVIPFGPFLCLGGLFVVVFWAPIWDYTSEMFEIPWLVPSAIVICLPLLAAMLFGWRLLKQKLLHLE